MTAPGFEWTKLYPRIAKKLFEKKDDTLTSCKELITSVCNEIDNVPPPIAGKNDPFSFFELFHGGLIRRTLVDRLTVCTRKLLSEEPGLSFVNGVPAISFRSFQFNEDRKDEIQSVLWNFFAAAMADDLVADTGRGEFIRQYKRMEENEQILPTTAVVLFMMRPDTFLPLDSTTRAYLKKNFGGTPTGWPEDKTQGDNKNITYTAVLNGTPPSAEQYLFLCQHVNKRLTSGEVKNMNGGIIRDFAQLSYEAWLTAELSKTIELLESNHQVILTGAPGTGKTYTAKQVAKAFVDENKSFKRFTKLIPDFDEADVDKKAALKKFFQARLDLDFVEKLPDYDPDKWQEKLFTARVQFHPGYDYSDFVIGMKPILIDSESRKPVVKENGNLVIKGTGEPPKGKIEASFIWEDGAFKKFADRARTVYDEWCNHKDNNPKEAPKFVFIIDEINRADLSRVFGELFSLLEESYRYSRKKDGAEGDEKSGENSITLPNGDEFVIPENLYIIGTMNDIDRSVESMDFALRRRFAWLEVTADESTRIIRAWATKKKVEPQTLVNLEDAKDALNEHIRGEKELSVGEKSNKRTLSLKSKLGPEYELGGAYFTKFDGIKGSRETYEKLWNNHLKIILGEYLRGDKDKADILDALHDVYLNACGFQAK